MALGPPPGGRPPASMLGLEHEYSLSTAGGRLDFREVIHDLDVPGRRLDPGDVNAYRCWSGLVITCDAEDAEVVSPPLPVQPGFAVDIAAWAGYGKAELLRLLPPGVTLSPFSTHLSASMPDELVVAACALFARTFAPALMLVLDRADSHGVFIRPRPGRMELCGEHAMGARLGAAAALFVGGARACANALLGDGDGGRRLPPLLAADVRWATGRHGLFVGRHLAFGYDLYAAGRRAPLPLEAGGVIPAQEHLLLAWHAARAALGSDADDADWQPGQAIMSGAAPLGVEGPGDDGVGPLAGLARSPFGDVLGPRRRPGFEAAPVATTWDFTVFRLSGVARQAYASVPGAQLGTFLERLDAGILDGILNRFLDTASAGQVLIAHEQTAWAGLWDDAIIGPDLLPYERTAADDEGAAPVPTPLSPVGAAGQTAHLRRGKVAAAVAAAPPPPLAHELGSSAAPAAGVADGPADPGGYPPPVEPPRPPFPLPAERPQRRRLAPILLGSFLVLLLAAGAAAISGVFGGNRPVGVDILTSPAPPPGSSGVSPTGPSTTSPGPMPTFESETTTVASEVGATGAPAVGPTVPPTVAGTLPPTPVPTKAVTVPTRPVTTVPVATTAPLDTTAPPVTSTTIAPTTVTAPPPTRFVVAVTSGILGCAFQPSSATAVAGSTVRFRNDTGGGISVAVVPAAGANTTISLDAGGTSGSYALAAPGPYAVTCTAGGDSVVGRMTISITNA